MEASIKKMEPNSGEKETVVERQKIPNEEVAVHTPRACRSETAASQEATEANTEKSEPDPGTMQSVEEHQEVPKEEAAVMPVGGLRSGVETGIWPRGATRSRREESRQVVIPGGD
jgi:hypothetical protein